MLTERVSRFEINRLIPDKTTLSINAALSLQETIVTKFITLDNGREFSKLKEAVTCLVYYCHAYASFEQGKNENHNWMIRRFLPKGTRKTTSQEVNRIEKWMNHYPKKCSSIKHIFRCSKVARLNLQFALPIKSIIFKS